MTIKKDEEVKIEIAAAWQTGNPEGILRMKHDQVRCSKCSRIFKMMV